MPQPQISQEYLEELEDLLTDSKSWNKNVLIKAILQAVRDEEKDLPEVQIRSRSYEEDFAEEDLRFWHLEDIVKEAISRIEDNYNGEVFSIDAGGKFIIDMKTLQKERELMDVKMAQHEPVDLAALGCISCGFSVPETLQCLEAQVADNEYGTLPMPFETPGGSKISFSHDGKMSVLVQGVESRELLEDGFKDLSSISSSRERAIKLVSEMGMAKDHKVENENSLSM